MAIVDVANRPWVVEITPDNIVAEFSDEQITVEVPNGTPLVEFRCCTESSGVAPTPDPAMVYDFFAGTGLTVDVEVVSAELTNVTYAADFATNIEVNNGVETDKVIAPDTGAFAYDRFYHHGQHHAGKGTATKELMVVTGECTPDCRDSNVFRLVVTEDCLLKNPINPIDGQVCNFKFIQDDIGGYALTFDTKYLFVDSTVPSLSLTTNAKDMMSCQYDETDDVWYCSYMNNFGNG